MLIFYLFFPLTERIIAKLTHIDFLILKLVSLIIFFNCFINSLSTSLHVIFFLLVYFKILQI